MGVLVNNKLRSIKLLAGYDHCGQAFHIHVFLTSEFKPLIGDTGLLWAL